MEISVDTPLNRDPCADYNVSKIAINGVPISDLRSAVGMYITWEQRKRNWTSRSEYDKDFIETCRWEQLKRIAKPLNNDIHVESITSFIRKRLDSMTVIQGCGKLACYEYICATREHVVDFLLTLAGSSPKILAGIGM